MGLSSTRVNPAAGAESRWRQNFPLEPCLNLRIMEARVVPETPSRSRPRTSTRTSGLQSSDGPSLWTPHLARMSSPLWRDHLVTVDAFAEEFTPDSASRTCMDSPA